MLVSVVDANTVTLWSAAAAAAGVRLADVLDPDELDPDELDLEELDLDPLDLEELDDVLVDGVGAVGGPVLLFIIRVKYLAFALVICDCSVPISSIDAIWLLAAAAAKSGHNTFLYRFGSALFGFGLTLPNTLMSSTSSKSSAVHGTRGISVKYGVSLFSLLSTHTSCGV